MKYYEVRFTLAPCSDVACDVLCSLLADEGFETFVPTADGLVGYVQQALFDKAAVDSAIAGFLIPGTQIVYEATEAPDEDWNQTWEAEGFAPVVLDGLVCVHDTVHSDVPHCRYDIIVNPRMAFGTGTHPTTQQILRQLCRMNLAGCRVVDAGCGTGVLGILCALRGATEILAYDIDEWSVDNTRINAGLNGVANLTVREGDASVLPQGGGYDLLLANINRNVLIQDMPRFVGALKPGGRLLLSGFYVADVHRLVSAGRTLGLELEGQTEAEGWAMLLFRLVQVGL